MVPCRALTPRPFHSHLIFTDPSRRCAPYLKHIIAEAKKQCPDLPIILYISNSGALVERMAACNPGARCAAAAAAAAAAGLLGC